MFESSVVAPAADSSTSIISTRRRSLAARSQACGSPAGGAGTSDGRPVRRSPRLPQNPRHGRATMDPRSMAGVLRPGAAVVLNPAE
jgi:hypothetical protein